MSDGLNLSNELFNEILATLTRHDERGREDMLINLQYLVVIAGYFCADFPGPKQERDELLAHLSELMQHVCNDRAAKRRSETPATTQTQAAAAAPAQGKSVPTADPAVGIWQPD